MYYATIRYNVDARMIEFSSCDALSYKFFEQPEVRAVLLACMFTFKDAKFTHDPAKWARPLRAGTECPRSISAFMTRRLRQHFPSEDLLVFSPTRDGAD